MSFLFVRITAIRVALELLGALFELGLIRCSMGEYSSDGAATYWRKRGAEGGDDQPLDLSMKRMREVENADPQDVDTHQQEEPVPIQLQEVIPILPREVIPILPREVIPILPREATQIHSQGADTASHPQNDPTSQVCSLTITVNAEKLNLGHPLDVETMYMYGAISQAHIKTIIERKITRSKYINTQSERFTILYNTLLLYFDIVKRLHDPFNSARWEAFFRHFFQDDKRHKRIMGSLYYFSIMASPQNNIRDLQELRSLQVTFWNRKIRGQTIQSDDVGVCVPMLKTINGAFEVLRRGVIFDDIELWLRNQNCGESLAAYFACVYGSFFSFQVLADIYRLFDYLNWLRVLHDGLHEQYVLSFVEEILKPLNFRVSATFHKIMSNRKSGYQSIKKVHLKTRAFRLEMLTVAELTAFGENLSKWCDAIEASEITDKLKTIHAVIATARAIMSVYQVIIKTTHLFARLTVSLEPVFQLALTNLLLARSDITKVDTVLGAVDNLLKEEPAIRPYYEFKMPTTME